MEHDSGLAVAGRLLRTCSREEKASRADRASPETQATRPASRGRLGTAFQRLIAGVFGVAFSLSFSLAPRRS